MSYLDNALSIAKLGAPVDLFLGGQKANTNVEWELRATTDEAEIRRRAIEEPKKTNYSIVAKAVSGGFVILDDDGGIRAEYEKIHGKMQPTRKHQSPSGSFHYLYKHSAASLAFHQEINKAYISETGAHGELWSLRMHNAYVVGPGSVATSKSGITAEYKVVYDAPIIEIPDSLLMFLVDRYKATEKKSTDRSATWMDEPIPEGERNKTLFSIGCALRKSGLDEESILAALSVKNEKQCVTPIPNDELRTIAHSAAGYEPAKTTVILNGKPADGVDAFKPGTVKSRDQIISEVTIIQSEREKQERQAAEEATASLNLVREPFPGFPIWTMFGTSTYENFCKPWCDRNSRYPQFLWMPALTILLNILGNKVRIADKDYPLSFYLGCIGKAGRVIKSSCVQDAIKYFEYMGLAGHNGSHDNNANGRSLVFSASSPEGLGKEAQRVNCRSMIMFYDELKELVDKASIESSTFKARLLTLYESGKFQGLTKSSKDSFSFMPGSYTASLIFCATDKAFQDDWSKLLGKSSGLSDRMFFLYQPEILSPLTPQLVVNTQDGSTRTRQLIEKAITQGVYKIDDSYPLQLKIEELGNRGEIRAEKLALAIAIDMGADSITEEAVERGIALIEYEKAVKRFLAVGEAETREASIQFKMIKALERVGGVMTLRDFRHTLNPGRYGTTLWNSCYFGLIKSGHIKEEGRGDRYDVKRVRLIYRDEESD